ncbi:ATP-binding protein [Massilibacteroides sp.]|uniref:hybrid sensor histidine kinase/response regulator n=1 Tax=Massilibacteroides sp. TaxID=2034766 RepID=UPI002613B9ED|nr:ATP-binding protein [Massilibacteroides sp.]MDD4514754.1 ATP-binding protein [Massilibacteroides sp.]
MQTTGILHDKNNAYKILGLTCDTLLLVRNDGVCEDAIIRTVHPYISDNGTILGKNIFDVLPDETVVEFRPEFEGVVNNGIISNKNYDLPTSDKMYYFKCIMQRYDPEHVICQYRDITKRSQMKKRLQSMNQKLRETEKAAKIGQWRYDTQTGIILYAGFADRRYPEGHIHEVEFCDYCKSVHVDDIESLKNLDMGNNGCDVLDYRILGDDIDYMRIKITESYTERGHFFYEGYIQNITDLIEKRSELEMTTMAVNNSNDSIYATYLDGTVIFANKLCRAHNHIAPTIDISQYKAFEILDNITDQNMWNAFVDKLLNNNNILKYVCKQNYKDFDIIASDCTSYIVKNSKGEDIIWSFRRDISDQLRYEEKLVKAKEKAEESDRLKSAFLSNMSHEIRTPLNAIVGFSGIIADTDDAETRRSYYNIIETNNERLLQLVNEILDLSKIESGTFQFSFSSIMLKDLFEELLATHQVYNKMAKLFFDPSPDNIVLMTDKNRLAQVISNLINNAIKFTPKGEIHFGYKIKTAEIEFYVKDTGIGIAPDKIDIIFDRFVKVDSFAPGTGLGLAICKTIVQKLGGSISATSKKEEGTIFTFTLPYERPKKNGIKHEKNIFDKDSQTATPLGSILVVEDILSNFNLIKAIIGTKYLLYHATTGSEAIEMFNAYHPDIILMDIKIPGMDGIETTKQIRKVSKDIPIIAVTAYAYEEEKKKAMQSGCNDFISKPVDKNILLEILTKHIKLSKKK